MASIRSVLIRSCMATIQKELVQLEEWLSALPDSEKPVEKPSAINTDTLQSINRVLEGLSKQVESQNHTLVHIMDRLDVLEEIREIRIDSMDHYLDTDLENITVDDMEPFYHFNKEDILIVPENVTIVHENVIIIPEKIVAIPEKIVAIPENITIIPENVTIIPEKIVAIPEKIVAIPEKIVAIPEKIVAIPEKIVAIPEEIVAIPEKIVAIPEEIVAVPEEIVAIPEKIVAVPEEIVAVPEEIIIIPEEEEHEYEEIEFKKVKYYKRDDGLIYEIDEEEQPTEVPVGQWNEAKRVVLFFKTKK